MDNNKRSFDSSIAFISGTILDSSNVIPSREVLARDRDRGVCDAPRIIAIRHVYEVRDDVRSDILYARFLLVFLFQSRDITLTTW